MRWDNLWRNETAWGLWFWKLKMSMHRVLVTRLNCWKNHNREKQADTWVWCLNSHSIELSQALVITIYFTEEKSNPENTLRKDAISVIRNLLWCPVFLGFICPHGFNEELSLKLRLGGTNHIKLNQLPDSEQQLCSLSSRWHHKIYPTYLLLYS